MPGPHFFDFDFTLTFRSLPNELTSWPVLHAFSNFIVSHSRRFFLIGWFITIKRNHKIVSVKEFQINRCEHKIRCSLSGCIKAIYFCLFMKVMATDTWCVHWVTEEFRFCAPIQWIDIYFACQPYATDLLLKSMWKVLFSKK